MKKTSVSAFLAGLRAREKEPVAKGEAQDTIGICHSYRSATQANTKEYLLEVSPTDLDTARDAFLKTVYREQARRGLPPHQFDSALSRLSPIPLGVPRNSAHAVVRKT